MIHADWREAKDGPWRRPPGVPSSSDASEYSDNDSECNDSEHLVSASGSDGVAAGHDTHQKHAVKAEDAADLEPEPEDRGAIRHLPGGDSPGSDGSGRVMQEHCGSVDDKGLSLIHI